MATPIEVILALLGFIPGLFKKKPYTLWYWEPPKGWKDCGSFSARQCKKAKAVLVGIGQSEALFIILRKGVPPPAGGPK